MDISAIPLSDVHINNVDAAPSARTKKRPRRNSPLHYNMQSDCTRWTMLRLQFAARVQLSDAVKIIQAIEEAAQDSRKAESNAGGAND
jgi:hypothetical protein